MASKTNTQINGSDYYRIRRKVGMKQNKSGNWVADYRAFYGRSKKEAEEKYAKFMSQASKALDSKKPIGQLIEGWIEQSFMVSGLSDGTKSKYVASYMNNFKGKSIAGVPACEITAMHLQNFYNDLDCVPSALRSLNNILVKFFAYASRLGLCDDITKSVELPIKEKEKGFKKEINEVEVWDDKELRDLIEQLEGHRLKFLVVMAVNTGARISELLALEYKDIVNGSVVINKQVTNVKTSTNNGVRLSDTKTVNSRRVVPLNQFTLDELAKHKIGHREEMERCGYTTDKIFTTQTGNYYDRRSIGHALNRFYKSHDIPRHKFHAFRHTFGTNLSRAGVPIEETAALMGHKSIDITAKYYININADRKRSAVEKLSAFM